MTRKTFALIACCLLSPAAAAAQTGGLTRVQLLALQQQLKEECGLQHSTGVMDGPTRHAIAVCNKKYGTQGNGAALLAAMDIGFSTNDNQPQGGMGAIMGNDKKSTTVKTTTTTTKTNRGVRTRTRTRARTGTGSDRGGKRTKAGKDSIYH